MPTRGQNSWFQGKNDLDAIWSCGVSNPLFSMRRSRICQKKSNPSWLKFSHLVFQALSQILSEKSTESDFFVEHAKGTVLARQLTNVSKTLVPRPYFGHQGAKRVLTPGGQNTHFLRFFFQESQSSHQDDWNEPMHLKIRVGKNFRPKKWQGYSLKWFSEKKWISRFFC